MRRFLLLAVLMAVIVSPAPTPTPALAPALAPSGARAGQPLDLLAYRHTIDRALRLLEEGRPDHAAGLLAGITKVVLPGGDVVSVDHTALIAYLSGPQVEHQAAAARLRALVDELDTWPAGEPAPDAFDKLADVLARPEFQAAPPLDLPLPTGWDNLAAAMANLAWPLLIVVVALLAAVVAYFAAGLWGSFVAQSAAAEERDDTATMTAGQARARSRQMADAGDYRAAVRLLYLSTLLLLEERQLLRYDRTLTNREYLRQVRDKGRLAGALRPVVDTFDEVWYGEIQPDAALYQEYTRQVDEVHEVQRQ